MQKKLGLGDNKTVFNLDFQKLQLFPIIFDRHELEQ